MAAKESQQMIGTRGEDLAVAELERQGMLILDRNWRCRMGEIDIVAMEVEDADRSLVFCEVKCRTGLGSAPRSKRSHMRKSASSDSWLVSGWPQATSPHERYGSTR